MTLRRLLPVVDDYWDRPLRAYAAALFEEFQPVRNDVRQDAFALLVSLLSRRAGDTGYTVIEVQRLIDQLRRRPVIQTGPHCHLIIEPDAFFTHLFSVLGIEAYSDNWYVSYGSSTVKFTERPKKGPGWLLLDDRSINVFGLSRRKMDPFSICGRQARQKFELAVDGPQDNHPLVDSLKACLPRSDFPSASEAIKAANLNLWRYCFGQRLNFLQIDDTDVAELTATHLMDGSSWLGAEFFGASGMVQAFLRAANALAGDIWGKWFRRTTDFFWLIVGGRLRPLRLIDDRLVDETGLYVVHCSPLPLASALMSGEIVPNLFITFLVLSILPGTRVLGGSRQVVYYPIMRHLLLSTLETVSSPSNRQLALAIAQDDAPGVWGHRTIAPFREDPWSLLSAAGTSGTDEMLLYSGQMTLGRSSGSLPGFSEDPLWQELARQPKTRPIW